MAWQEVAYWILAWIWVASGAYGALQALGIGNIGGGFMGPFSAFKLLIGIGLLTQNDFVIYIAKILTYFSVLFSAIGLVISFGLTSGLAMAFAIAYNTFELALAIFTIYIFGYMSD